MSSQYAEVRTSRKPSGGVLVLKRSLQFHVADVAHNTGHLRPLRSLGQQGRLVKIVCRLSSSLACPSPVRLILEAWVSLRRLHALLLLGLLHLLVH